MHDMTELGSARVRGENLFRLLVENVRDYAIFHLDPNGYIRSWNEGARRIKGYDASEIIGRHFSVFYLPHEARRGKPAYELAVASDEGRWEEEGWRLRNDGTRFWANVVITALYDPNQKVVGFAKVTRDLTERMLAEEQRSLMLARERRARQAAEEALEELRAIQNLTEMTLSHLNLDDVIDALLDHIQNFLEVDTVVILLHNPATNTLDVAAARGMDSRIVSGSSIPMETGLVGRIASEQSSIIVTDVSHGDSLDSTLQDAGISAWLGVPLLSADQTLGVLHVGSYFHRNFGEKEERFLQVVADRLASAIDRTRLIEAEQKARIEAETADAKLRAQDAFLAVAAHELRSPTASVKTAVQLLRRRMDADGAGDHEAWISILETADRQSDRLTRLVDKLIESVRIDSGQLGLELERTDIVALVNQTVELSRTLTGSHQIVMSGPNELWAWVDPVRMEQVVGNLVENATEHSSVERVEIDLDQPADDVWRLVIRDHGVGVPPEHRPHLFKRFYQGPTGTVERGLGLGLYICREIVVEHGGDIRADFPDDGGSCFTVTLPVNPPEQ